MQTPQLSIFCCWSAVQNLHFSIICILWLCKYTKLLRDLRFSQWCCWRFRSFPLLLRVFWYIATDIWKTLSALIFRDKLPEVGLTKRNLIRICRENAAHNKNHYVHPQSPELVFLKNSVGLSPRFLSLPSHQIWKLPQLIRHHILIYLPYQLHLVTDTKFFSTSLIDKFHGN
jgi:hypothetical protein